MTQFHYTKDQLTKEFNDGGLDYKDLEKSKLLEDLVDAHNHISCQNMSYERLMRLYGARVTQHNDDVTSHVGKMAGIKYLSRQILNAHSIEDARDLANNLIEFIGSLHSDDLK